jgi:phage terminase small subunit
MTADDLKRIAIANAETALAEMGEDAGKLREQIDAYGDAIFTAAFQRAMWDAEGRPIYAVGQRGALLAHPSLKAIQDAEWHAFKLAAALNLTPEARSRRRVGAPMGSSTANDRRGPTRLRKAA